MTEKIQIAIISAGLGALISGLFQLMKELIDNSKERRLNKEKKIEAYIEKHHFTTF
ncbi:MAG: hypothetical protein IKU39_02565 [Lachnospiraceae bacterium]|nr:hypothetical protein [Lachnospiraceae bacterium]